MGLYGQSTGCMVFDTIENKILAKEAIEKWVSEDKDGNDFPVTVSADEPCVLGFFIEGSRYVNIVWRLQEILKVVKPFGLKEFCGPVLVESEEDVYWNSEDEGCSEDEGD